MSDSEPVGFEIGALPHPRLTELSAATQGALKEFNSHAVKAMLAPNYSFSPIESSPDLERAFLVNSKEPMPRGFGVKVDGEFPVKNERRLHMVTGNWDMGLGTSVYPISKLPDALKGTDNLAIAKLRDQASDRLPDLTAPSHRISIGRNNSVHDGDSYALFVTANDVPAALALIQAARSAMLSDKPMSIEQLFESPAYAQLLTKSQAARDTLAKKFADAYGVSLNGTSPTHTTVVYSIVRAKDPAHGVHASLPFHRTRESRFYTIYNDAADASRASDGRAVVYQGVLGGHTLLANKDGRAWQRPKYLSILPSHTGEVYDQNSNVRSMHASDNARTKEAYASRVVWRSALGSGFAHPAARKLYYDTSDPYAVAYLNDLSPGADSRLQQAHYSVVVAQNPNISSLYAPVDRLARWVRQPGAPESLPLALDHPLVSTISSKWDDVIAQAEPKMTLRVIFSQVAPIESAPGSLGRIVDPENDRDRLVRGKSYLMLSSRLIRLLTPEPRAKGSK